MPPLICIKWRDAHQPMHAALGLQMSVAVLARYEQSHRFDSDFFALLNVHCLRFETAALDPALVHPKQHVSPIAGFGPACAGMNRDKRVRAIVFAGQELAQLELIQLVSQTVVFGHHLSLRLRSMRWIVFFRSKLLQSTEIFNLPFQFLEWIDQRTQSGNLFDISLGAVPTRPEI